MNKWFDYRILDDQTATKVFMREFGRGYGSYMKRIGCDPYKQNPFNYGVNKGGGVQHDLTQYTYWDAFDLARVTCDMNFVKYQDYWYWAFEAAMRMGVEVPYPAMFLKKNFIRKCVEFDVGNKRMKYADYLIFQPDYYRDIELQNQYYAYLASWFQQKPTYPQCAYGLVEDGKLAKQYYYKYMEGVYD